MMASLARLIMVVLFFSVPLAAVAAVAPACGAPTQPLLKPAELEQLLAPIALIPIRC